MNSFVFAYKNESDQTDTVQKACVADLHVNLWKVNCGVLSSDVKFFFDFGLRFHHSIQSIYVHIPFEIIEDEQEYDLIKKLQNNNQLLCAVFNCDLKSGIAQGNTFSLVEDDLGQDSFYLHQLGSTKFKCTPFCAGKKKNKKVVGTLLKILIQDAPDDHDVYIRFRIQPKRVKDVVKTEYISNDFLQAAFSKIDMFDFRVNETRDINTDIMDKIKGDKYNLFKFKKIHLFFMADSKEKVENGSSLKIDSRLLESELWSCYLPQKARKCNYIAHHWKKRQLDPNMKIEGCTIEPSTSYKHFSDYRIFFTSVYPKLQFMRLLVYLFTIILLGWVGSMLSFDITNAKAFLACDYMKLFIVALMAFIILSFFLVTSFILIIKLIRK